MDAALKAAVIWSDADVIELRISAWDGRFGGVADVYIARGGISKAAAQIAGFPTTISDTRELQFGAFGRDSAGGGARLRFYVQGGAGHTFVEIHIESDYNRSEGADSVSFRTHVEASAVDIFVQELQELEAVVTG
ncbi:MAG TPA: hypothetical protein VGL89_19245, partial [Candidatus Koribacter sp.]